jgi:hypothetical protein
MPEKLHYPSFISKNPKTSFILTRLLIGIVLSFTANAAYSEPVEHTYSTTTVIFVDPLLAGLDSVTGSFTYENGALGNPVPEGFITTGATAYGNLSAFSGNANGNIFSDPQGITIVGDDKWSLDSPPTDIVWLLLDPPGDTTINGFNFSGMSLVDVRISWREGQDGIGDFQGNEDGDPQLLPAILPPTIITAGRLVLDFVEDGNPEVHHFAAFRVEVEAVIPAGSDINFRGPLRIVEVDDGTGAFSGATVGPEFFGAIKRLTTDGFISDGNRSIEFFGDLYESLLGLTVRNDFELNVEDASILTTLTGTEFEFGDSVDLISVEGYAGPSAGVADLFNVQLAYVLNPDAFDNESRNNYPPNPDDLLTSIFFIFDSDGDGTTEDVQSYSAVGKILAEPEDALDDLIEDVADIDLPSGIETSLTSTLENALVRAEAGDAPAAMGMLFAFINQAEAQRGNRLSDEEADELIAAAEATIELLQAP